MNKFEFTCNFWSYEKAVSKTLDDDLIEKMMDDWKHSMIPFNTWKKRFKKPNGK